MAKKLKKKIEDLCGLTELDSEARQNKAKAILESSEWKQKLCNELVGLSFRELEHTLNGVATERKFKTDEPEKVYKNEKLSTYRSGKPEPVRRDSTKHCNLRKSPPRTLAEILHHVHNSPRLESARHSQMDDSHCNLFNRREDEGNLSLSDSTNDNSGLEE